MKRIAPFLATLALLLGLFPSSVSGHTTGGSRKWIDWPQSGYTHSVFICDIGIPDSIEPRIIDAMNEWNEIGGELVFSYADWSDATCDYEMATNPGPGIAVTHGSIAGYPLGQTNNSSWINGAGRIYNCLITMDSYAGDVFWGSRPDTGAFQWWFGTGAPGSTRVDWESVLVHEIGHCIAVYDHSPVPPESYYQIMDMCHRPNPPCGDPRGVENQERAYSHDTALYTGMYGTTH